MQVLVATRQTQGWRANDFSWTVEDELVLHVPSECSRGSIDDKCGCRRALAGAVSHRATTTMKVVDRKDLNPDMYRMLIADSLEAQGYVNQRSLRHPVVTEWVQELADDLMRIAAAYPIGTVLERRGDMIRSRTAARKRI